MAPYLSPGIYVEEIETGARPIEQVGTSVAAFVGLAPKAGARPNEAVRIRNFDRDFNTIFIADSTKATALAYAVRGFFENCAGFCYVVNLGDEGALSGSGRGLDKLAAIDEIAMVAAPGRTDAQSYESLLLWAERRGDCVALLDSPEIVGDPEQLTRVADGDSKKSAAQGSGDKGQPPGLRARQSDRGFGAYYYPWLRGPALFDKTPDGRPVMVSIAPSGHVAGLCARSDGLRGVHKAPANMAVAGIVGLSQLVSKSDQDTLNPAGVNCFRQFATEGVRLWGARTLAASSSNWRYLNVRRLFIMIEKSIDRSTRWIVFEPNDSRLWKMIRRDVSAFLTLLWRQGYLMGDTPQQAFFVKCDEETNPPDVVDAGRVEILIGVAPVKPAEFVVFRIGQSQAGATVAAA